MIYNIILSVHVIVCVVLIIVVLMQSSKGGGLAGAFGGGGDQTLFGGQETATFLSKATTYLAVAFMLLSLILAFLTSTRGAGRPNSILQRSAQQQRDVIPAGQSVEQLLGAADTTATTALDTVPADTTLQQEGN